MTMFEIFIVWYLFIFLGVLCNIILGKKFYSSIVFLYSYVMQKKTRKPGNLSIIIAQALSMKLKTSFKRLKTLFFIKIQDDKITWQLLSMIETGLCYHSFCRILTNKEKNMMIFVHTEIPTWHMFVSRHQYTHQQGKWHLQ